MIASTGIYPTIELLVNPWEVVAMNRKSTISSNIDWQAILEVGNPKLGQVQDQGPNYKITSMGLPVSPAVKVPKDMFNKLNTIAKANHIEPWEVIQELLEYRFKESA